MTVRKILSNIAWNTFWGGLASVLLWGIYVQAAPTPPAPCNIFTSALAGCVPGSGGGSTKFLRADGTWSVPAGSVTSVGLTAPGIFTVTGSPVTGSGTIAIIAAGTSGGIPYFSSAVALASSAQLVNHQIVLGGGAGAAPSTLGSLGTTTTVLHGNASGAPTFGAVALATDVSGNLPVTHLNSGTGASSGTYWRGDNTWAAAPGNTYTAGNGITLTSLSFSINDAYANVWTAQQTYSPVTLSISGTSFAPNGNGNNYAITLVHASCPCGIGNPTVTPVAGTSGLLIITQSSSGSDTISSWGSDYVFTTGSAPTLSTSANAVNIFPYYVLDATHIYINTSPTTAGTGTVTSVAQSSPNSTLSIGGSPINTSGTLTADLNLSHANVWAAQQSASVTTLTISTATFTPDGTNNHYKLTLVHASCPCTLANPSATPVAGTDGTIEVIQSSTGSDLIGTWGSQYEAPGGTATITLSTAANAVDLLSYHVIDSTHIAIVPALNFSH